jgi:hypothetical protein
MKKISTYLASALLMMVVFTSCSSSSEDKSEEKNGKDAKQENSNASDNASNPAEIDVAQLEEPCDYVDAMEANADKMLEIFNRGPLVAKELSEADLILAEAVGNKFNELETAVFDKKVDLEDCENFKAFEEKMKSLPFPM